MSADIASILTRENDHAVIRVAAPSDFAAFYPPMVDARVLRVDGKPVAIGLITRQDDGRLWMAIDTKPAAGPHTLKIVRAGIDMVRRLGEPVYAPCQAASFPHAPRLLRAIGFFETDELYKNIMKVWVCRNSGC